MKTYPASHHHNGSIFSIVILVVPGDTNIRFLNLHSLTINSTSNALQSHVLDFHLGNLFLNLKTQILGFGIRYNSSSKSQILCLWFCCQINLLWVRFLDPHMVLWTRALHAKIFLSLGSRVPCTKMFMVLGSWVLPVESWVSGSSLHS